MSIMFLGVLLNYAVYKYDSMRRFDDTKVITSLEEHFYSDDFRVKGTKGAFQVAFGLVDYGGDGHKGDFSPYGQIKARLF